MDCSSFSLDTFGGFDFGSTLINSASGVFNAGQTNTYVPTTITTTGGNLWGGTITDTITAFPIGSGGGNGLDIVPAEPEVPVSCRMEDGKRVLMFSFGPKDECEWKVLTPFGFELYTQQPPPKRFCRFVLKLLFGIRWEDTLAERFIEAL